MVRIREMLVPANKKFVNHGINQRTYITIHDTGNPSRGANAEAHARLQQRGNSREASWHWQVDDKEAIRSYKGTDRCWHAGDGSGPGNNSSEAIEICINSDGDFEKAVKNAAELTAKLMAQNNTPISRVVQHNRWSGKNCPATLRRGHKGINWNKFLEMVRDASGMEQEKPAPPSSGESKTISALAKEVIAGKHGNGDERKRRLGSRYASVQAEVNRILGSGSSSSKPAKKSVSELAKEVIAGKHGNGAERKKSLGSQYADVQAEVNRQLVVGNKSSKSISQLATEVIQGKHGNGAERKKSLGSQYAAVQAEVNRRLS